MLFGLLFGNSVASCDWFFCGFIYCFDCWYFLCFRLVVLLDFRVLVCVIWFVLFVCCVLSVLPVVFCGLCICCLFICWVCLFVVICLSLMWLVSVCLDWFVISCLVWISIWFDLVMYVYLYDCVFRNCYVGFGVLLVFDCLRLFAGWCCGYFICVLVCFSCSGLDILLFIDCSSWCCVWICLFMLFGYCCVG